MIRLIDILREIAEEASPTPEEQKVIDDLLGSLQEGAFDSLLAKAKSYAKKGLLTATVIAALVASPELSSAQKSQVQKLPNAQTALTKKAPTGTSVDSILGQYTSQFKFPHARLKVDKKIIDLGLEDNKTLDIISNFDKGKMDQWNKFVDWMKVSKLNGKTISGNPTLDADSDLGQQVIDAYRQTEQGENFFAKSLTDIAPVQKFIKAYRLYTVADWKLGDGEGKGGHTIIELGGTNMHPNNPADVKAVEDRYMRWAKD